MALRRSFFVKSLFALTTLIMIALRQTAFRVLTKPSASLICRSRSIQTLTATSIRTKPLRIPISHLQLRFASEEAQTQSEPAADRAEEGQHGTNSIAAASPEQTQSSRVPEAAADAPVDEQPSGSWSAQEEQPRTLGEFASAAAGTVKQAASNVVNTFGGQDSAFRKTGGPPNETVYVGNLFFDVREEDLKREFQKIGPVETVKLIVDNRGLSKGFGYVTFKTVASAEEAVNTLDQRDFEGRRLTVQFANQRSRPTLSANNRVPLADPSRTLFIGNLSFEISDRELNSIFRDVRNVIDVRVAIDRRTGQPRGFAHADFTDVESAKEALVELAGKEVCGRPLRVDYSQSLARQPPQQQQEGY
ncbi:MAG: hypothetical protein Q9196_002702 [Gyalolechia fulgens]